MGKNRKRHSASFLGEATIVTFFSLTISLVLALSFFYVANLIFRLPEQFAEWRISRKKNSEQAARVTSGIVTSFIKIMCLLALLALVVQWDIELFRFRYLADILAIEDPRVAATTIPTWQIFYAEHSDLFSANLIDSAVLGYLAMTILACLILETSLSQISSRFSALFPVPIDDEVEWPEDEYLNYEHDHNEVENFDGADQGRRHTVIRPCFAGCRWAREELNTVEDEADSSVDSDEHELDETESDKVSTASSLGS